MTCHSTMTTYSVLSLRAICFLRYKQNNTHTRDKTMVSHQNIHTHINLHTQPLRKQIQKLFFSFFFVFVTILYFCELLVVSCKNDSSIHTRKHTKKKKLKATIFFFDSIIVCVFFTHLKVDCHQWDKVYLLVSYNVI